VQRIDERFIELEKRLATCADDESLGVVIAAPGAGHGFGELIRPFEATPIRTDADKIRVAELADRSRAILLATTPQIASSEAAEHCGAPGVRTLALERVENFLHGVRQCVALAA
jgi:hypothetical protein